MLPVGFEPTITVDETWQIHASDCATTGTGKLSIYKPIWNYGIKLWVLRQQVQQSHHAEIPIQNPQRHSKCTPVCNKSYPTYRLQHPLRN